MLQTYMGTPQYASAHFFLFFAFLFERAPCSFLLSPLLASPLSWAVATIDERLVLFRDLPPDKLLAAVTSAEARKDLSLQRKKDKIIV